MVPHHEMANVVLERRKRPELKELANGIVTAQTAEISQMKEWRKMRFGSSETLAEASHRMPGMDLAAVTDAADVDKAFIDQMILHHQSARSTWRWRPGHRLNTPRFRDLAGRIASAQKAEIGQMEGWRGGRSALPG